MRDFQLHGIVPHLQKYRITDKMRTEKVENIGRLKNQTNISMNQSRKYTHTSRWR